MRSKTLAQILLLTVAILLTSLTAQAARVLTITRAFVDLNGDGKRDSVSIKMTSGRTYAANDPADETCPSCECGAKKYKGNFVVVVQLNGKKAVRQNLNQLMGGFNAIMFWAERWRIVFSDYNQDGQVDFNLGQPFSCNGWAYWLFTIRQDGHISQLEVEKGNPYSEIFASDDANSTRLIRPTAKGFYTKGYYNAADPVGFYTSYYAWDKKKRSFIFRKDVHDRNQNQTYYKPHWARR